ncbi:MAG: zf-HC2 domain-containing protein [Candidatus Sulfotelmatobacter sp.]
MQDVPKIVRQQLKASAPASTRTTAELHPDADLLTAFAEHALGRAERASVVEHLALCGDCRDVVALALPANETVVVPATADVRSGWLSLPVLRWGVVTAGLLVVTSVGVQQYRLHHHEQIVASNVVPSNVAQSKNATGAAMQSIQALPQAPVPNVDSKPLIFAPGIRKETKEAHLSESTVAAASSTPAAGQQLSDAAPTTVQVTTQTQLQVQLAQNQRQRPLNGGDATDVDTVAKAKDPVPAVASASPCWAITPAGTLQRSLDDGETWQDINPAAAYAAVSSTKKVNASPSSVPVFRAVAAAGLEVWAGGSAGALYHAVDGGDRWTLVLPSTPGAILTGDITSIQFPDAQHGSVATSTTEVWITADGGQTWRKQQ